MSGRPARRLLLALLLLVPAAGPALAQRAPEGPGVPADVQRVVGAPRRGPLAGPELERKTIEVASVLRCPVCQGLSVADSPATMAVNMRHQVRDMLAAGYDADQVIAYFESSYGEFVRLQPALRGVNWLVWGAPALALLAGGFAIRRMLRARPDPAAPPPATQAEDPDALPEDPRLAAAVLRVRAMAYGWPGGVRPGGTGTPS